MGMLVVVISDVESAIKYFQSFPLQILLLAIIKFSWTWGCYSPRQRPAIPVLVILFCHVGFQHQSVYRTAVLVLGHGHMTPLSFFPQACQRINTTGRTAGLTGNLAHAPLLNRRCGATVAGNIKQGV